MKLNKSEPYTRFRHHFLNNGGVLTVVTQLNYDTREVKVGWSVFNANDKQWIRKIGNAIAKDRLDKKCLTFTLSDNEPILCDYISLRALMLILAGTPDNCNRIVLKADGQVDDIYCDVANHPFYLPNSTREAIFVECLDIVQLLGNRVGIDTQSALDVFE